MSANECRRLAAKIDQHMQQLAAQGVSDAHAIWADSIGNGCLTWMPSKTRCGRRAQNPRCRNT